jgi:NAD(P)-dependent dehydrogenase (short-subunit alcohol dehydrogenase family)
LSTQRVNRGALPHMRVQGRGLLVWVSSSSVKGNWAPYLAPYFAAKAAMEQLAVSYAGELARYGIESVLIVPGAFTKGTNHFQHAMKPRDESVAAAYASGPASDIESKMLAATQSLEPVDADPTEVGRAVLRAVRAPYGKRPFRITIDPTQDGSELVAAVQDRFRRDTLLRVGLGDILHPTDGRRGR